MALPTDSATTPTAAVVPASEELAEPPGLFRAFRKRVFEGLLVATPVLVTAWILIWLGSFLNSTVLAPTARALASLAPRGDGELIATFLLESLAAPVIAIGAIFTGLYFLGLFARSRLHRAADWFLLHLPVVTPVYRATKKVVDALDPSAGPMQQIRRVVLVEFPHPGMKAPAFVTNACTDPDSGKVILCVYVPTTPVPTSGYMLLVPEEQTTELNWSLDETLQAVISGGITAPRQVRFNARAAQPSAGPMPLHPGDTPSGRAAQTSENPLASPE